MKNRVIHFDVKARDIDRAKAFYEKTFGWSFQKMMSADQGGFDYWGITTGPEGSAGINGGMSLRTPVNKSMTYECTIEVEDIDKALEDIAKNGGTVDFPKNEIPGVGFLAGATDSEGNGFGLIQPTGWQAK